MKKITTLILLLFVLIGLEAQTIVKVQGVPRQMQRGATTRSEDITPGIAFDKIVFWVGAGDKESALIVKWPDGKGNNHNLVWGYRWSTTAEGTGESMLRAVAKADPRFYLLAYGNTQYGAAFGGIGFDLDGNGEIGLMKKGVRCELIDNICYTSAYDFDSYTAVDPSDHWISGWLENGYWSYWSADDVNSAYGYSAVGATDRVLEDGSIDGWSFSLLTSWEGNDMSGDIEYVTQPTLKSDYTKGMFVINEGWYGHQNSSVNYLSADGQWIYRAFQKENPGKELGATSQFGTIYGDKFYIVAKQSKDPGAAINGARLTVCDAKTLKCLKQIESIATDDKGKSIADGRAFLGVDEHKGYISTSNGIYVYDIDEMEIKERIAGSVNPSGGLYTGQIGTMIRVNEKVFAVHQSAGLLVIDPQKDEVSRTIQAPLEVYGKNGIATSRGFGSVVLSKDGNLWLSVCSNTSGNGGTAPYLLKVDPSTCDTVRVELPKGIYAPANSWYAWTPDGFCASKQNNVLYWNGGQNSFASGKTVIKYDIDKNEFSTFLDFNNDADSWGIYGCSFRIDPVTDHAYVSLSHGFGDNTYLTRVYNAKGEQVKEYSMINEYWFPALPVFPDNAAPIVAQMEKQTIESQDPFTISLAALATDADNLDAAIVKSVKRVSDETVLKATLLNDHLVIAPQGKKGEAEVTVKVNSNGKIVETIVAVNITADGVGLSDEEWVVRSAYSHNNQLYITNCEGYHFVLYNAAGAAITSFHADANLYSVVADSPSGIYFLRGTASDQAPLSFKVMIP